jgi:hypothetical protein
MYRYSIRFLCFMFNFWNSISAKRGFTFTLRFTVALIFTLIFIFIFISMSIWYNLTMMEPCWVQQTSLSNLSERKICIIRRGFLRTHGSHFPFLATAMVTLSHSWVDGEPWHYLAHPPPPPMGEHPPSDLIPRMLPPDC